ncbi:MAG: hypothetical protein IPJ89_03585 [Candidatus Iainarchaeum archaeon]|uniref:Type II secretion system F family protein n=1 Tax=Candidatus Iainarchaeum sp. TaxID=3101447 RepID=A0A7T9DJ17_9ARCH|nr:MAG: hypothetical protein IPJ89_03585 [Candidatus Diapherotrites archaeon]
MRCKQKNQPLLSAREGIEVRWNPITDAIANWKRRMYAQQLESGMDAFLSLLLMELEWKQKMEWALRHAAAYTPAPLQGELTQALERFESQGMSLEESLLRVNAYAQSTALGRVIMLLIHLSKQGTTPQGIEGLRRMQEDLRIQQQAELKAYGSRLALLSLVFIGVSALVPAMFLAFVSIGSSFLELSLSAGDILSIALIGFPLLDAIVLGILWMQTPYFVRARV